jgi:glycosyltransferase involved in cell wall biosynthesis
MSRTLPTSRTTATQEVQPALATPLATPEVTIVIPTRDRPQLLRRALASALAQRHGGVEVVVVDDGSVEPVPVDHPDPRVRVFRNDRLIGVSASRNVGLAQARGRWVAFLDDDDELLPDMVKASLDAAAGSTLPPPVAVLSRMEVTDDDGDGTISPLDPPVAVARGGPLFLRGPREAHVHQTNSLFAPVEVLRSIGGWDGELKAWEDDDLLLRMIEVCSMEGLETVTYRLHDHSGVRLHDDAEAMLRGADVTLARYRDTYAEHPRLLAKYLAIMSRISLEDGRRWRSARLALEATWRDPRRPRAVRQLVASLIGVDGIHAVRRLRGRAVADRGGEARAGTARDG